MTVRRRAIWSLVVATIVASVPGCELLPSEDNACRASGIEYEKATTCEGHVLVTTRYPCIDGRNRDNPPPKDVDREDCTVTGKVCSSTSFDESALACRRICRGKQDCAANEQCGKFETPTGSLVCSEADRP